MILRILSALLFLSFPSLIKAETAIVAVASNMSFAAETIKQRFIKETGKRIQLSFGSSGNLTRQIMRGAPFQVFLSADSRHTQRLKNAGKTRGNPEPYAQGRLCLFIPNSSSLNKLDTVSSVISKISHGHFNKIAMANPELAPYGHASVTALQRVGIWAIDSSKVVLGENVGQTTKFTITGSVDLGMIPYSHAIIKNVKAKGQCHLVPDYWHDPIIQEMALLKNAGETATEFYKYLKSEAIQSLLRDYGYATPN